MVNSDLRRLLESLEKITANVNSLKAEIDLFSEGGFSGEGEEKRRPAETPQDHEWLPLGWLQDLPVLPPVGGSVWSLLGLAFERLSQIVQVDRFVFFLSETETNRLIPRAGRGVRQDDLKSFSLGIREGITGRAFHEGRPITASAGDPGNANDPLLSRFPVREAIALPVRSAANVVGVLYAGRIAPVPFEACDQALLRLLAHQIGIWIHAGALFGQMKDQVDGLKELVGLSLKLTSPLELSMSLATTAEVAARLLRVQAAAIVMADSSGTLAIRASVGLPPGFEVEWRGQRGVGLVGEVVQSGHPVVTADFLASASPSLPFGPAFPVRGLMVLPLKVRDESLGCVILADPLPRAFSPEEVEAMTLLSNLAAIAIEHARLYDEACQAYQDLKGAQEQLIHSEKARVLSEIAGGIVHDFNNVLAIILGTTGLTLNEVQDPRARKALETIEEAAWRGAGTIRHLQSFAATREQEKFVAVELNAVILDAVVATRPRWKDEAESRGLRIEMVTDLVELPRILGNPIELREMVVNLLLNAVDAMPEGGRIVIKSRPAGKLVEMSLSDTGVGMSEAIRPRIFDPFFTTKSHRSGLGLAVVRGILDRHQGQVEVSSEEGKRTTFRIHFPVALEALKVPTPAPGDETSRPEAESSEPARILVIEDEIPIQGMLVEILMGKGHTVWGAVDGREGLAIFEREPIDVVFTDLSIPEVSGWDVARAVKKRDPRVPVVLVTGWGDQIDSQVAQESGVDLVVSKPFRMEAIHSALRGALSLRHLLAR